MVCHSGDTQLWSAFSHAELSAVVTPVWCCWGVRGPRLSSGRQESKQPTNLFTCVHDFIQYARIWKKTVSGLLWQEATKTMLVNKDNLYAVVYTYSLQCVFVSQYSNKVDFITMSEAQMGHQSQTAGQTLLRPLEATTGWVVMQLKSSHLFIVKHEVY